MGIVQLEIIVGPLTSITGVVVIEHDLTEPLILGRSWLAEICVVASPTHQLIKFKCQGEVITIEADHETDLPMIWMPYPNEFEGPPQNTSGTWPVGSWIDNWDDEAPSFQGFQHLASSHVTQGYAQIQGPAQPNLSLLPVNQGQSLLRRPTSLLKPASARGGHHQAQQALITRTGRMSNQVVLPPPNIERAMSPPRQEFNIPRKIEGEFDVLE